MSSFDILCILQNTYHRKLTKTLQQQVINEKKKNHSIPENNENFEIWQKRLEN